MVPFVHVRVIFAAVLLLVSAGRAFAQSEGCPGCTLQLTTYKQGYYLGFQAIPGVWYELTLGEGSGDGHCVGVSPECEAAACAFRKITVQVENTGAVDFAVNFTTGLNRATLEPGSSALFPCVGSPGGELIQCGAVRDVLQIVLVGSEADPYVIALRCTPCPWNGGP
ncbi:MAG: hypothetical protein RL398_2091 [Planctomycetota bacterium]